MDRRTFSLMAGMEVGGTGSIVTISIDCRTDHHADRVRNELKNEAAKSGLTILLRQPAPRSVEELLTIGRFGRRAR